MEAVFEKVYQKIGITQETAKKDLEIVRQWCQNQPHLPEVMDDSKIRNFLVLNKHSIERTKQKIDMYYTIRSLIPEFYDDCNPNSPHFKEILETTCFGMYPFLIEEYHNVIIYKVKKPNTLAPRELALLAFNYVEFSYYDHCAFSDIIIIDMLNITLNDITKLTPSLIMKILTVYEKVFSIRIGGAYVLNAPPYVSRVLAILKKVMKPKIFSRIHTCPNTEILKNLFTVDTLPEDYGGRGPSLQEMTDDTKKKFEEHRARFDLLDKMRVDESLRPQRLDNDEVLGFYGSFKKLNFD